MKRWTGAALVGALAVHAIAAYGAPLPGGGEWTLSGGMEYSSGSYGGAASTNILYLPFSAQYATPGYRFKVTVPVIRVDGPPRRRLQHRKSASAHAHGREHHDPHGAR